MARFEVDYVRGNRQPCGKRIFIDITSYVLGQTDSYNQQLLRGADYWRTVLDGHVGVDVTETTAWPSATSTTMA